MGTFEQIRRISPYLFGFFALVLVLFFTIGDQTVVDGLVGRRGDPSSQVIGEVNNKPIYYVEFEQKVRERIEQQRNQVEDPTQINEAQIRSQVWREMVEETLLNQEAKKVGIAINAQMLADELIENPPEYLKRSFRDTSGQFQKDLYLDLITNPNQIVNYMGGDPSQLSERQKQQQVQQFRDDLIRIEGYLKRQKLAQRLQTTVEASSSLISPTYSKNNFIHSNSKADLTYLAIKTSDLKDQNIEVSDEEIKNYYDEHKKYYKQDAQRKIKYIAFRMMPSADDSARASRRIDDVVESLNDANTIDEKDSIFDLKISEYGGETHDYQLVKDIPAYAIKYIGMLKEGNVAGPVRTREGVSFFRLDDRRTGENINVKASHILVKFGNDKDSAKAEAKSILKEARGGEDFSSLAMKYSQDPGSGRKGGDLGWFGKGQMVKPFEQAAFKAEAGEIVGPVESQFGYHIIKVDEKSAEEIAYSELSVKPKISTITKNQIYRDANSASKQIEEGISIDTVAKKIDKSVRETQYFESGKPVLGSQYLSDKAFKAELGDVIEPDEYDRLGVVVAQVADVRSAGIKPLKSVRKEIENRLLQNKKLEDLKPVAEQTYSQVKGLNSLEKASEMVNYSVNSLTNIKHKAQISGIGKEPVVAQKIFSLPLNRINEPVKGQNGWYILQIHSRSIPEESKAEEQFVSQMNNLMKTSSNSAFMQWFTQVKENAQIIDNRSDYYKDY